MPELPEVETVRLGLVPALEGQRLAKVITRRADLRVPFSPGFAERLTGCRVLSLKRRAKYILAQTDGLDTLVIHLGMSGRLTIFGPDGSNAPGNFVSQSSTTMSRDPTHIYGPHDHVVLETDNGVRIIYTDHRRFGVMILVKTSELYEHKLFKNLGPEPLEKSFTGTRLSEALHNKRTPIKAALLDQRVVAGLGNIYVCEALFRAKISPKRMASSVAGARAKRLVPAIKYILRKAIAAGGSSLRDYAHTDGELGYFQHSFSVYDRQDKACPRKTCSGKIKRLVQAGRSAWYCSTCQR
ncbi:MAG: bifunctional DNA-formamidopyrimidine glycosylase/DNA-(apurinic or apyrimidinic site) lyase [Alphaproteobacteria bacterium]